jgi:glucose/arabinose dehydrogenase
VPLASNAVSGFRGLALAGFLIGGPLAMNAAAVVSVPTDFTNDLIVGGLSQPISFAFLPDGRILFTEQKTGRIRMIVNGHIAATNPVYQVPAVNITGQERGLLGIAVDPEWPTRPYVYFFQNFTGGFLRLARMTAVGDLSDPNGENLTLGTPLTLIGDIPDLNPNHNAGSLRFGPDGMLYLSLGDDDDYYCQAADRTSLRGQILRLKVRDLGPAGGSSTPRADLDPGDNPWAASANANEKLVWAYGFRNPWRFQIDRLTGVLYGCDVGESNFEEEDEIVGGGFYGWPWREANFTIQRPTCPEPGGVGAMPYVAPIAFFGRDFNLHAIVSAGMYRPAPGGIHNWPLEYYPSKGDVFYLDYYVGDLKHIRWNGSSWVAAPVAPGQPNPSSWATGLVTACDFLVGPDGSLYWLAQFDSAFSANSGSLNRIRWVGNTSVPPVSTRSSPLRAIPNPSSRSVDLAFTLSAPASVHLAIYDLGGRRIRRLLEGDAPAGDNGQNWDGLNDAGRAVPAGVYVARLEIGGAPPVTRKLMHLR